MATCFWGFGFVAAIWALEGMSFLWLTGLRFGFAFLLGIAIVRSKELMKMAAFPGIMMGTGILLQTWGLVYTTATKSTFITCLYVVFVPFLEALVFKKRLSKLHLFFTLVALVGLLMLVDARNFNSINIGDALTFLCALFCTFHIVALGKVAPFAKSPLGLNTWQCFWSSWPMFALLLIFPSAWPNFSDVKAVYGLVFLAFFSSFTAFLFMVRAQRFIAPSLASIFFLLETPFGAFFAWWFLNDKLNAMQWAGAGIIFLAVLGALITEFKEKPLVPVQLDREISSDT